MRYFTLEIFCSFVVLPKIFMTGSTILGIFLGSRTGGTYIFEVGSNLMLVLVVFMVLASSLAITSMWMSK